MPRLEKRELLTAVPAFPRRRPLPAAGTLGFSSYVFGQAAKRRADGGCKGGVVRDDVMDAIEPLKVLEIRLYLVQGCHGAGENDGLGVAAAAGQHGHGADGLQHQVHNTGGHIGAVGVLCQVAKVSCGQGRVQSGCRIFCDISNR